MVTCTEEVNIFSSDLQCHQSAARRNIIIDSRGFPESTQNLPVLSFVHQYIIID